MKSFDKFKTAPLASAGQPLNLLAPDGSTTGEWICVRGQESNEYQDAQIRMQRAAIAYVNEKGEESKTAPEYVQLTRQLRVDLISSLVVNWSFPEPCNSENILDLLTNAPYIAHQIDIFSGKRERFALPWPSNSEPTPPISSN